MLVQQNDGGNQIFFPAAYSDERLKTNIRTTQVDALAAVAAVEVVKYDWTEDGKRSHGTRLPSGLLNMQCRRGARNFEATLWIALAMTRRASDAAGSNF